MMGRIGNLIGVPRMTGMCINDVSGSLEGRTTYSISLLYDK